MSAEDIKRHIKLALDNAKGNGYSFTGWPLSEIACDLQEFDSELESVTYGDLLQALVDMEAAGELSP